MNKMIDGLAIGILSTAFVLFVIFVLTFSIFTVPKVTKEYAEFLCETHGLELDSYKHSTWDLTKVECVDEKIVEEKGHKIFRSSG